MNIKKIFEFIPTQIYYWGESRSVDVRRKRRDVPSSADSLEVLGGNTRQATLTGLKPFTNYNVVVKAFNSAGEGPESATMSFETLEGGKRILIA